MKEGWSILVSLAERSNTVSEKGILYLITCKSLLTRHQDNTMRERTIFSTNGARTTGYT
jgi:hypothetical protein